MIEALLGAGGKCALGSFDYICRTPLICAVYEGHLEAAQVLIDAGSDVDAHDEARAGDPALRQAVGEQDVEMVELLLSAGADPTVPGCMRISALHDASKWRDSRMPHLRRIAELIDAAVKNPRPRTFPTP